MYTKMLFIAPDSNIKRLLDNELKSERFSELLERNSLFGERRDLLDIDLVDASIVRRLTVNSVDASHRISNMYWEGETLFGRIEILSTLYSEYIKTAMEEKDIGWFLPRIIFLKRDEYNEIDHLHLVTFDFSKPTYKNRDFTERCRKWIYAL